MSKEATITVEVSPGELIDKITILEIKAERIQDEAKRSNVLVELEVLTAARDRAMEDSDELAVLTADLHAVNARLWDIEDGLRDCARRSDFGDEFVRWARAEYTANDERARIKRRINELLRSRLMEEKSYEAY